MVVSRYDKCTRVMPLRMTAFIVGNVNDMEQRTDVSVDVQVGGVNLHVIIDSGASCNILGKTYRKR